MRSCPGRTPWAPFDHDRLALDVMAMRGAKVDRLVCLLPPDELVQLGVAALVDIAATAGLRPIYCPIEDGGVPGDVPAFARAVREVLAALGSGETVVVHCQAGLGRTALFAASCLIARGAPPVLAIERVRTARPGALQLAGQERFLHGLSARSFAEGGPVAPESRR